MLIDIDKIIIKDRIRKDYGNIEELANDIRDNGLINPPVVTEKDGELILIAGERRTRACKYLDYRQIEVRVMTVKDALHQLKLEISENENRKDFSYSEKMQWAEQLREEYSKIAKENMRKGRCGIKVDESFQTRDKIVKDLDMSAGSFSKAQYIWNNADEEIIKEIDEGTLTMNKAYNLLKGKSRKPISNQVITSLLVRSKGKCECCGFGGQGLENIIIKHHIHKYADTEDNSLSNLIMLCPNCHGIVHTLENCKDKDIVNNILSKINSHDKILELVNQLSV